MKQLKDCIVEPKSTVSESIADYIKCYLESSTTKQIICFGAGMGG